MEIEELIELAKKLTVTEDQLDTLRERLKETSNSSEKVTHEFLNRTYNL